MGLDCRYQGFPSNSKIIKLAYEDADFAQDILYPAIAFTTQLEDSYHFREKEFDIVRKLFKEYPDITTWNYSPVSRMQNALIYTLNPDSYLASKNFAAIEKTLPYKIVKGEKTFNNHLKATQGLLVRVSSPEFVMKCAEFCRNLNLTTLYQNFDAAQMEKNNIYKISKLSNFEAVEEYFINLSNFYFKIARYQELLVFVVED